MKNNVLIAGARLTFLTPRTLIVIIIKDASTTVSILSFLTEIMTCWNTVDKTPKSTTERIITTPSWHAFQFLTNSRTIILTVSQFDCIGQNNQKQKSRSKLDCICEYHRESRRSMERFNHYLKAKINDIWLFVSFQCGPIVMDKIKIKKMSLPLDLDTKFEMKTNTKQNLFRSIAFFSNQFHHHSLIHVLSKAQSNQAQKKRRENKSNCHFYLKCTRYNYVHVSWMIFIEI